MKRLDDIFWTYSTASRCLVRSFNSTEGEAIDEEAKYLGRIAISFDDETLDKKKRFISRSKILANFIMAIGFHISIDGATKDNEVIIFSNIYLIFN